METRGVTATVTADLQVAKVQGVAASQPVQQSPQQQQAVPQQAVKKPKSYRHTLLKLSNTISNSSAEIMERYDKQKPSLTLHFYKNHWKFANQDGVFLYNSPARHILEAIRNEQVPVDCLEVFRDLKVEYYEGCLIVRLVDNREDPPTIMHTALRQSPESIWTEMLLYSEQTQGNFTDAKALQVESDILVATNPPLDLRPSFHPAYSASLLNEIKDKPLPRLKRKRQSLHEDDEEERLMYLYDERHGKEFAPDFKRLAFVEANRKKKQLQMQRATPKAPEATKAAASPSMNGQVHRSSQSPMLSQQGLLGSPQPQVLGNPNASGANGHMSERPSVPAHLQNRPSASPQPVSRQAMNQQVLAHHLAMQNQALQNGGVLSSPRMSSQVANGAQGALVTDLARQQHILLQQRAMALRNINANRAAQAQAQGLQSGSPRMNSNGQLLPSQVGTQNTPTPLQMQQIMHMQAQQQQQQQKQMLLAQQQQALQNSQYQQMR